ncbi:MAG: DUF5908 family protein [Candidatus Electrothrix aestuarii]|uniref:DUF5908 family protein n=1 Tax=Candidatus Electrothrix aestuarii TaxID=3062594 RepID=A0AAU8LV76_9BACT|nr:DUF5908 family protein [Candidatus Electrothrix aestuarii]
MAIEIKKLIIKTVIEPKNTVPAQQGSPEDFARMKARLLKECHQMIQDSLRWEKER